MQYLLFTRAGRFEDALSMLADGPLGPAVPGDFRVAVTSSRPAPIAVERRNTQ